jgi:radial spoke head protein 9
LPVPEPADGEDPAEPKTVTEIDRLAVIVAEIDTECAMLPAGALTKKADGSVVDSPTFAGLDHAKATSAKSFVFVNQPKAVSANADAMTAATDFLTTCDELVPTNALVSKFDEATNVVTWRSLLYPGFLAYCTVGSATAGYVYSGNGEKNADIAFMLP